MSTHISILVYQLFIDTEYIYIYMQSVLSMYTYIYNLCYTSDGYEFLHDVMDGDGVWQVQGRHGHVLASDLFGSLTGVSSLRIILRAGA